MRRWINVAKLIAIVAFCTAMVHVISRDYDPALRVIAGGAWAGLALLLGIKAGRLDAFDEIATRGDDDGAGA